MDLISYLERAALESDVLWRSGDVGNQSEAVAPRAGMPFADNAALARLIEARPTMICMIATPDGGDTDSTEDPPDEPVEDAPDTGTPDDSVDR